MGHDNSHYVRREGNWHPEYAYTTTEQKTGRKWVDGKPIYRQTFTGTITQAANTRNFLTLTTGIAYLISAQGMWEGLTDSFQIGAITSNDALTTFYNVSWMALTPAGALILVTRANETRTIKPYSVTIEYTKL